MVRAVRRAINVERSIRAKPQVNGKIQPIGHDLKTDKLEKGFRACAA